MINWLSRDTIHHNLGGGSREKTTKNVAPMITEAEMGE
uniref:Uncharacterized protein n=1 Tax=Arundo donax TaxID=35708 RepID=A0A0A8YDU7_ARUDO